MRLGKMGHSLAMSMDAWRTMMFVLMVLYWIAGWFVASITVFLRRDFGERFMSWLNIFFGLSAIRLFCGFGNMWISSMAQERFSSMMELLYFAALGLAMYHRFVIWQKNRRGFEWHSLYSGTPWIQIPGISADVVTRWIEPLVLFILAYLAGKAHETPIQLWLNIAGFSVLVYEHLNHYMQRQTLLDMRDSKIESTNWSRVMEGAPPAETHGYTIAQSNLEIITRSPEMRDAFMGLNDDVRGILDLEEAA